MSTGWTRVIEGYYKCPGPFAVTTSALTAAYSASLGGHRVTITLPSAAGTSMHHNDLAEPDWNYPERDNPLSRLPELAPYWGQVVVWANDHTTPKAVSVRRFRIATDAAGDDYEFRDVGRQLAEAAPAWWAAVSAWIETLHHQDLSRLGPIEPGLHFNDTTLWTRLYSLHGHPIREGALLPVGSSATGLVWPNYAPIDADQIQQCIAHAEHHGPPPAEWLLIRDANSLCAGHDFRRAVLDAGLAAELAVTQLISVHMTANGQTTNRIETVLREYQMLGRRCTYSTTAVARCPPTTSVVSSTAATPRPTPATLRRKTMCATRSQSPPKSSPKLSRFRRNETIAVLTAHLVAEMGLRAHPLPTLGSAT